MAVDQFKVGYVLACANIVHLHGEPTIAANVMADAGVTWREVMAMGLSEYDMKVLRIIKGERSGAAFLDGRTKSGRRALAEATRGGETG